MVWKTTIVAVLLITVTRTVSGTVARQLQPLEFEAATVKVHTSGTGGGGGCRGSDSKYAINASPSPLGRCVLNSASLTTLIGVAYSLPSMPGQTEFKVPERWMTSERWDVHGKAQNPQATEGELRQMLQALLTDRFALRFHQEAHETTGYVLVEGKNGPKLIEDSTEGQQNFTPDRGKLVFKRVPIQTLTAWLRGFLREVIVDKTGLTGKYSFDLTLPQREVTTDSSLGHSGSIFTILQEELGLRLERQKVPVVLVVIDQAQKPVND